MDIVHNLPNQKGRRKYLRNNATEFEKLFWQEIRNNKIGYKFRRQHGIKKYIVDFYCPELKLIVELDGEVHGFKRQKERDYLREKELEKLNLHIIRYTNFNILENLEDVIIDLKNICNKLKDEKRKLI